MSWTEQKIQTLKGNGYSASEIAKILGGLSRNAVIGKAHRLKLSARAGVAGAAPREAKARVPLAAGSVMPITKVAQKRTMLRPLPVVAKPSMVPAHKAPMVKETFSVFDRAVRSEGICVTKATERHCRWPVGDPRSPEFRFCGCTIHDGLPYCIDHARIAYQSVGRKQRAVETAAGRAQAQTQAAAE